MIQCCPNWSVQGHNRDAAIERAITAIDAYEITGVSTTLDFGRFAIDHAAFRSGSFDTHFVSEHFHEGALDRKVPMEDEDVAKLAVAMMLRSNPTPQKTPNSAEPKRTSNWKNRKNS